MKQQISRLSPHQNGKVFGVLMAIATVLVLVPLLLIVFATAPPEVRRPPLAMILLAPLIYLVIGYVFVAIGCAVYNLMFKLIGGVEFETRADDTA